MPIYTSIPHKIVAIQYTKYWEPNKIRDWIYHRVFLYFKIRKYNDNGGLTIGSDLLRHGDYIVVKGRSVQIIQKDVFEKTYKLCE
jgi:hypothetical protein